MRATGAILHGVLAVAALLFAALPVRAQEALYLRTLAANCAQCHGTDGHPVAGSPLPALAGRPRDELVAQLKAFKAGTRPSTIMQQLARGYSDEQIDLVADYFSRRSR